MVDEVECEEIMNNVSSNVKMLVDVAHLKVSQILLILKSIIS